jgi:uncharacterized radical SAM superfamily Fe-S cluster-containing enzyme
VALQLDGFDDEVHRRIRGKELQADKDAALAVLEELDIPTQLIFVATRGVNDHQIGRAVELLLSRDHILSLNFQPAAYTGSGGGAFDHDPLDRLTIPGVIHRIEEQTGGRCGRDFPLPCSHPQCVSLTYLLRMDDGSFMPFGRFIDFDRTAPCCARRRRWWRPPISRGMQGHPRRLRPRGRGRPRTGSCALRRPWT